MLNKKQILIHREQTILQGCFQIQNGVAPLQNGTKIQVKEKWSLHECVAQQLESFKGVLCILLPLLYDK